MGGGAIGSPTGGGAATWSSQKGQKNGESKIFSFLAFFTKELKIWEFYWKKIDKFGFLKKIGKFKIFIEKSAFLMNKIKEIVGATEGRWDYIFYRTD